MKVTVDSDDLGLVLATVGRKADPAAIEAAKRMNIAMNQQAKAARPENSMQLLDGRSVLTEPLPPSVGLRFELWLRSALARLRRRSR